MQSSAFAVRSSLIVVLLLCDGECHADVGDKMLLAKSSDKACLLKDGHGLRVDVCEQQRDVLLLTLLKQHFQRFHDGYVKRRNATHADDQHAGVLGQIEV